MDDLDIRIDDGDRAGGKRGGTGQVRSIDHLLADPPSRDLDAVVVVPVRDEALALPDLVASFARQRRADGTPFKSNSFELAFLYSRCVDGSPEVAAMNALRYPRLRVLHADLGVAGGGFGVGRARRLLMDAAARRLEQVRPGGRGVILTTDADTLVAPDWLGRNLAAIHAGADAVGGQVLMKPDDRGALPPGLRRRYLMDHTYQRLVSHLAALIDPDEDDPLPRHHQHAGASLAVTVEAYRRVGGMPPLARGEDEAFFRALKHAGARFRHSVEVRTFTSGRLHGRVERGLAGTLRQWAEVDDDVLVEAPEAVQRRLRLSARLRALHAADQIDPERLTTVATSSGLQPARLERLLMRRWPFFRLQEAILRQLTMPLPQMPLDDAVAGLRRMILRYESTRSSRSSRQVA